MRTWAALVLPLALAGCEHRSHTAAGSFAAPATRAASTVSSRPPVVVGVARPLGDPADPVSEPRDLDRSTPAALLASLAAAVDRHDAVALARLRLSLSEKPVLDEHDVARARLDFLSHGVDLHWKRVLAAVERKGLDARAERLLARADLGGSLGVVTLRLERTADGWVLR